MSKLSDLYVRISGDIKPLKQALGEGSAAMSKWATDAERSVGKLQKGFASLKNAIGGAIAVGAAMKGLQMIQQSLDRMDQIGDTAQKLGITAEKLQELNYAAQMMGVSSDNMANAWQKFTLGVGQARAGTGKLKEVFDAYGISLTDTNGVMKTTEQLFDDYSKVIRNTTDVAERMRIGVDGMGKAAGPEVAAALAQGSQAMSDYIAKARELGIVLSDEMVAKAGEAKNSIDTLKLALQASFDSWVAGEADEIKRMTDQALLAIEVIKELSGLLGGMGDKLSFGDEVEGQLAKLYRYANDKGLEWGTLTPEEHAKQSRQLDMMFGAQKDEEKTSIRTSSGTRNAPGSGRNSAATDQAAIKAYNEKLAKDQIELAKQVATAQTKAAKDAAQAKLEALKAEQEAVQRFHEAEIEDAKLRGEQAAEYAVWQDEILANMRAQLDPKQAMIDKLNEELELMREAGATEAELTAMRLEHSSQVAEAFEENAIDQLDWMDILSDAQGLFVDGFSDEMAAALTDGKANFADFARTLLKHIMKLIIQMTILRALEAGMSAYNMRGLSPVTVTAQRMPMPTAAMGGAISGPTIVGERGRELFIPSSPGQVISNHDLKRMGSGSVKVEVVNRGTPQKATQTSAHFDARGAIVRVVLEDIARNGPIASGLGSAYGLRRNVG